MYEKLGINDILCRCSNDYTALDNKAIALFHLGNHTQALQILDRALALNPHDSSIYYNKGYLAAIDNYNMVLKITPQDKDAFFDRQLAIEALEAQASKGADLNDQGNYGG